MLSSIVDSSFRDPKCGYISCLTFHNLRQQHIHDGTCLFPGSLIIINTTTTSHNNLAPGLNNYAISLLGAAASAIETEKKMGRRQPHQFDLKPTLHLHLLRTVAKMFAGGVFFSNKMLNLSSDFCGQLPAADEILYKDASTSWSTHKHYNKITPYLDMPVRWVYQTGNLT